MMERLVARGERAAARAVPRLRAELAAQLSAALPSDIAVEERETGVRLTGRGIVRRLVLDPPLRWMMREARK